MQRAKEQFTSFYGNEPLPMPIGLSMPLEEITNLGDSGYFIQELSLMMGKVVGTSRFSKIFEQVVGNFETVLESFEEQVAASELLRRFGKPQSVLAVPVFLELAGREVGSKVDTARQSFDTMDILHQAKNWLEQFIQMVNLALIDIAEEIESHQMASENLENNNVYHSRLTTIKEKAKTTLSAKRRELLTRKINTENLQTWLIALRNKFEDGRRPVTIFSSQSIAPSIPTNINF